ncbi:MAG TPA: hypothetical protein VHP83_14995 [Aggregatilineaceae bacterium]|nr:hypothetical protein [Aggregatilineaceae bacterium]
MENYHRIGIVLHYFDRIHVAVIRLEDKLYTDDWILLYGPRTEFTQQVYSMQVNHEPVGEGEPGEDIALKVDDVVREGDEVYLVSQES